jgi:hypothetical protein
MGELRKPGSPRGPGRPDAQFRSTSVHPQKKSRAVPLMMLGGAALVGLTVLGRGHDVQRNRYGSLEECVHDYSTGQCELDNPVGSSGGGGGLHYYGPWYRSDRVGGASDPGAGRSGPHAVEFGTRGGFGASGRVFARAS